MGVSSTGARALGLRETLGSSLKVLGTASKLCATPLRVRVHPAPGGTLGAIWG